MKVDTTVFGGQRSALVALFLATAAILAAWAFEIVGGYEPCPLCLTQRWAYYGGIPALFFRWLLLARGRPGPATALVGLVALSFLVNAGIGVYHSGVEWHWWPGPTACAAGTKPLAVGSGGLLEALKITRVVRCDEAPWRMLGLSFAGWNAVISATIAVLAAAASRAA